jgi:hypothetical protein
MLVAFPNGRQHAAVVPAVRLVVQLALTPPLEPPMMGRSTNSGRTVMLRHIQSALTPILLKMGRTFFDTRPMLCAIMMWHPTYYLISVIFAPLAAEYL